MLFDCAKTVSECYLFDPLGLTPEREQIPQAVRKIENRKDATEPLEAADAPYKHPLYAGILFGDRLWRSGLEVDWTVARFLTTKTNRR